MMRVRTFAMPQLPFFLGNIALDFYHHSMLPKKIALAFGIAASQKPSRYARLNNGGH